MASNLGLGFGVEGLGGTGRILNSVSGYPVRKPSMLLMEEVMHQNQQNTLHSAGIDFGACCFSGSSGISGGPAIVVQPVLAKTSGST